MSLGARGRVAVSCAATRRCGRSLGDLLEYDHTPAYETTGHTITSELELRCAPCHHQRHRVQ